MFEKTGRFRLLWLACSVIIFNFCLSAEDGARARIFQINGSTQGLATLIYLNGYRIGESKAGVSTSFSAGANPWLLPGANEVRIEFLPLEDKTKVLENAECKISIKSYDPVTYEESDYPLLDYQLKGKINLPEIRTFTFQNMATTGYDDFFAHSQKFVLGTFVRNEARDYLLDISDALAAKDIESLMKLFSYVIEQSAKSDGSNLDVETARYKKMLASLIEAAPKLVVPAATDIAWTLVLGNRAMHTKLGSGDITFTFTLGYVDGHLRLVR